MSARPGAGWIRGLRPARNVLDPGAAYACVHEQEPGLAPGDPPIGVSVVLLTNTECPWTCVMCDLWRNTLAEPTPPGALPTQVRAALDALPPARWIKLYNAGSFFDDRAVPPGDRGAIAELVRGFERVIVECHPRLVDQRAVAFAQQIDGQLEVALGLETADPDVLARLNKGMTLDDYRRAAAFLAEHDIALRTFVLIQPPFQAAEQAVDGARRAAELAFACGSASVSLIPTRAGNGAMERLIDDGLVTLPTQQTIAEVWEACRGLGRVHLDGWGAVPDA